MPASTARPRSSYGSRHRWVCWGWAAARRSGPTAVPGPRMAGQARDLQMTAGCESPLIITARACLASTTLLAQPLDELVLDRSDVGFHLVEPGAGGLGGVVFSGGYPQLVADRVAQDRLARRAPQGVQQLLGGQVLLRQDIEVHQDGGLPGPVQVVLVALVLEDAPGVEGLLLEDDAGGMALVAGSNSCSFSLMPNCWRRSGPSSPIMLICQ